MVAEFLIKILRKGCVVVVAALFLAVTSVSSVHSFSIKEERETGEKLLFQVRRAFPLLEDPDLVQYINSLGREVLEVAGPQYFHYRFFLIDSEQFNAFAAPSGLVFFFTGLITMMNSEDELVAVLAHEIGHVVKRHIAAGIDRGAYTNAAALGLAILGATLGGSAGPGLMTGALAAGQSVSLHYSREHEQEADLCAYEWMKEMGRDPAGEVRMLQTMRRIARYRSQKLPQYLLTHPNPEERMNVIESFIESEREELNVKESDNFEFLRFKYRILAQVKDPQIVRPSLLSLASRVDATEEEQVMAQFGLSQLAWQERDYTRALELIKIVRKFYPDRSILAVDQGVIEAAAGMDEKALFTLQQAVAQDNQNMYGYFALGKLRKRLGQLDEAVDYFLRVQSHLPEYSQVYFELGQIESARGNSGLAQFYLGKFNLHEGKLDFAKESLRKASRNNALSREHIYEIEELLAQIERVTKK